MSNPLITNLRSPLWVHSASPRYESPQLSKEETVADLIAAADEIERLRECLEWLDRRGGLGHDVHDRIRASLVTSKLRGAE